MLKSYVLSPMSYVLSPICPFMTPSFFTGSQKLGEKDSNLHFPVQSRVACHWPIPDCIYAQAAAGGIEPPILGLTGRRLTVWPRRISYSGLVYYMILYR